MEPCGMPQICFKVFEACNLQITRWCLIVSTPGQRKSVDFISSQYDVITASVN